MSRGKRASEGRGVLVGVEGWASGLVPMLCDACGSTPDQILLPNSPNKVSEKSVNWFERQLCI